jgi:APA family basic amino acid/polyamine antiporter
LINVCYFIGINKLVSTQKILQLGNDHISAAAVNIFNIFGINNGCVKIFLIFIVISIIGIVNGFYMGNVQLVHSLAVRNMLLCSKKLMVTNKKDVPLNSSIFVFLLITFWSAVNYLSFKFRLLADSDIAEVIVVISYFMFSLLYIQVIKLFFKKKIRSFFKGFFNPTMALIGAFVFILQCLILNTKIFFLYFVLSMLLFFTAIKFYSSKKIDNVNKMK